MNSNNCETSLQTDDKSEINWMVTLHFSQFAGFLIPFGGLIAPFVIWRMKRSKWRLIDQQGKEILNFQLSLALMFLILGLGFLAVGFGGISLSTTPEALEVISSVTACFSHFCVFVQLVLNIGFPIRALIQMSDGKAPTYPGMRFIR